MVFPTTTSAVASAAAACVLASALAACAAPRQTAADGAAPLRVMVKLKHPSDDANAIVAEAGRVAGVPVTYAAATSTAWHALFLHCVGARCDDAIARLRAADTAYQAVEIDGRKTPAS
jgi:hypothetical protein